MRPLHVTKGQIDETLSHLKMAGVRKCECVVLWLGKYEENLVRVTQVYRPDQTAREDIFRIDHDSICTILETLSSHDLMIAAQVHSHPFEAFHSRSDDQWAIVRHVDALSLVVPYFCQRTNRESFFDHTKTFKLNGDNQWVELSENEAQRWIVVR